MTAVLVGLGILASVVAGLALVRLRAVSRTSLNEDVERAAAARMDLYCPSTGLANRRRAIDWLAEAMAESDGAPPAAIAIALDPERYDQSAQAGLAGPIAARISRLAAGGALASRLGPGG